ncbi:MAG: hypothetical protein BWY71_01790 [Planctomycetes bacterium ADurb.Bin412]|nr:MAG: hypothetical protein BWY71_01790 [Planctomycetes bacterium ADurb.Bin412]
MPPDYENDDGHAQPGKGNQFHQQAAKAGQVPGKIAGQAGQDSLIDAVLDNGQSADE